MDEWKSWTLRAKRAMRDNKVTQAQLAEKMGVTQGQVGHWLNGRRSINLEEFMEFAKFVGADPQVLLFGNNLSNPGYLREIVEDAVNAAIAAKAATSPNYMRLGDKLHRLPKKPIESSTATPSNKTKKGDAIKR